MTGIWNGEQLVSNKSELQTRLIQHIVKDRIHKGTATDLINYLTTTDVSTCPHVKYDVELPRYEFLHVTFHHSLCHDMTYVMT